ncbi:hypothetical protein B296_00049188, partial [Ensete ventricosum]
RHTQKTVDFGAQTFHPPNLPYPFNRSTYPSLHNAANSDLSQPSSLIAASSDPLRQRSYQQQSFTAICLHRSRSNISLPTVLIAPSNKLNRTSSGLSLLITAVLLRNSRAHRCPVFLLLQPHPCCDHATRSHEVAVQAQPQPMSLLLSSTSTIAAAFRLRSLGCHLPTDISNMKNNSLDDIAASP